ncbi:MAG: hypothetical protein A3F90_04705 [Deltaproteobacteria bacterium RIFCSPLOWO2_12_FULL_60_19]|nr:MAG: hypothetical protein A3F90_04705 [Deltaproteobacteria bacterium RIFCSPLOWO2_12_FULL_60_19]
MAARQTHETQGNHTAKKERLETRITADQKAFLLRAAAITGRTMTDFVVSSAYEVAVRTVHEHEVMTLSARDREAFVATLLKPEAPSSRLRKAARRYAGSRAR